MQFQLLIASEKFINLMGADLAHSIKNYIGAEKICARCFAAEWLANDKF